jgi:osmotically-inducible protein OsmY
MRQKFFVATLASAVIGSLAMAPAIADDADTATPVRATGADSDRSMGEVVDDATIVARVKSTLLSSSEVEGLDVNVDARNGIVTLSGSADTMAEKSSAERLAKAADGVKSVDNKIVIKADDSATDADQSMAAPRTAPAPAATPADATPPAN